MAKTYDATKEQTRARFGKGLIIFGMKPPPNYKENLKKRRLAEEAKARSRSEGNEHANEEENPNETAS